MFAQQKNALFLTLSIASL